MEQPRILETHACQGGATAGYLRAGWDVTTVDIDRRHARYGWDLIDPVTLCGCMFDLSTIDTDGLRIHLQRPRLFETSWGMAAPRACDHSDHEWVAGAYGGARRDKYEAKYVRRGGYVPPDKGVVMALLGVEHPMTWNGLFECVPPAYTAHVGNQLRVHLAQGSESTTDTP